MENFILFVIAILTSNSAFSLGKIILKSGENIEAKVFEINLDEVKSKKLANLE
jgi:hypothetical protein